MYRVITVGEALTEFLACDVGTDQERNSYRRVATGAELAYAIGMARLGYTVDYVSCLGKDRLGEYLFHLMEGEGLNTEYITFAEKIPTGIVVKEKSLTEWPDLTYCRRFTAGSALTVDKVKHIRWNEINHMHVSGIAVSLSKSSREAVMDMIWQAHEHDITVSFDPNIRTHLWTDEIEMVKIINGISILCDIVFPEVQEAQKLLGTFDPDAICDFYMAAGVKTVVLKYGAKGIFVKNKKERFWTDPYPITNPIDMMGVGEGFVVGVTSAILEGRKLRQAIERGRIIAANVALGETSYDTMPRREELVYLINEHYGSVVEELGADKVLLPDLELDIKQGDEALRKMLHQEIDPLPRVAEVDRDESMEKSTPPNVQKDIGGVE